MASTSLWSVPEELPLRVLAITAFMFTVEWIHRDREHGLQLDDLRWPRLARWVLYQILVFAILSFGVTGQQFIYFQF